MQTEQVDELDRIYFEPDWQKRSRREDGKKRRKVRSHFREDKVGRRPGVETKQRRTTNRFRPWVGVTGVYLIHFDRPLAHAKHYLGMAEDIAVRLARHAKGKGSKMMQAIRKAGIDWNVVRVWRTDKVYDAEKLERQLKGNNVRNCTVCSPPGR